MITNIKKLKEISQLDGITLHILSICREDSQMKEKNEWLDINAPFFHKDNRHILSKETIQNTSSANMKLNFLRDYKSNNQLVLLDDDNQVLKTVGNNLESVNIIEEEQTKQDKSYNSIFTKCKSLIGSVITTMINEGYLFLNDAKLILLNLLSARILAVV